MQNSAARAGDSCHIGNQKKYLASYAKKIESLQILDQSEGDKVSSPDQFDKHTLDRIVDLIELISSQNVSAQVTFDVMQRTVATCHKVNMGCGRKRTPSLLDSGTQVTLTCQSYFEQEILPHIRPSSGEKAEAPQLTAANNGKFPMSMYVELDLAFLGIIVPKVEVPITQEVNELLDECCTTKLHGIIGWNLIKLAFQVFVNKFGLKNLEYFDCPILYFLNAVVFL